MSYNWNYVRENSRIRFNTKKDPEREYTAIDSFIDCYCQNWPSGNLPDLVRAELGDDAFAAMSDEDIKRIIKCTGNSGSYKVADFRPKPKPMTAMEAAFAKAMAAKR